MIYKECGITLTKYRNGIKRGVYFAPLYENTKEFLTNKISEDSLLGAPSADILPWWEQKAIKRYTSLYDNRKLKSDILWYSDIMFDSWENTKHKYLQDIGR